MHLYVLVRTYIYLYVFIRFFLHIYMRIYTYPHVPPLSYPNRGPPWGDPPIPQPTHLCLLLCRLHSVAHAPFVLSIVKLVCRIAQANLILAVDCVLLLWHLRRFPFHDSTGFHFLCISKGKPYVFENKGYPFS